MATPKVGTRPRLSLKLDMLQTGKNGRYLVALFLLGLTSHLKSNFIFRKKSVISNNDISSSNKIGLVQQVDLCIVLHQVGS